MLASHARAAVAAAVLSLAAVPAAAQNTENALDWSGRVAPGRVLYVRNLNGGVKVERGGGELQITARKRWRRGDPDDVRVEVKRLGGNDGDVVVCGLWGEGATCDPEDYRNRSRNRPWGSDNGDVSVEFVVRVPDGVRLDLKTTNGGLEIEGATAEVRAETVNGGIRAASLGGPVTAKTVNGGINVRMGNVGREDLSYETVNGGIVVEVPNDLNAEVELRTVNGGIESDFPLSVQGRINPRRINAVIGSGGRRLSAETVNGGITLRRAR